MNFRNIYCLQLSQDSFFHANQPVSNSRPTQLMLCIKEKIVYEPTILKSKTLMSYDAEQFQIYTGHY